MTLIMLRSVACGLLFALACQVEMANAQATIEGLPENWSQLPPGEFAAAAEAWLAGKPSNSDEIETVRSHASTVLLGMIDANSADYDAMVRLQKAAGSTFSAGSKAAVARYLNDVGDVSGLAYQQLRAKTAAMFLAGSSFGDRAAQVAAWVDQATQEEFDAIWIEEWVWIYMSLSFPHVSDGNISVRWAGQLSPPETGDYKFSISPIDVNATFGSFEIAQDMQVSVNGQPVVVANAENWQSESQVVRLVAGQVVPFEVEVKFLCYRPPIDVLHAMVYWEGPGMSRRLIPSDRLTVAESGAAGLQAEYSVRIGGAPQTFSRVDPQIDFCWTTGRRITSPHRDQMVTLTDAMWPRCLSEEYLALCTPTEGQPAKRHILLTEPRMMAECLTTAQRASFCQLVASRPELLSSISFGKMHEFYKAFRMGAPDEALDVLGAWGLVHKDLASQLPPTMTNRAYFETNRLAARDLTIALAAQLPRHAELLQEEYLESESGECVLPIAYLAGYCHLANDRMAEWIAFLDEKLDQETLAGDRRVNWLIARAFAEEIRSGIVGPYDVSSERLLAGRGWLDEASLVAESEPVRLRILQEKLARSLAELQPELVAAIVSEAEIQCTGGVSLASIASWKQATDGLAQAVETERARQERDATSNYQAELQRRLETSQQAGDQQEASRIEQLLQSATSALE
jgi:hypothetical protein